MRFKYFLFLVAVLSVPFTALAAAAPKTMAWTNPVWTGSLADPFVLYDNGVYYACGTGQAHDGKHFPMLRSKDLGQWEYVGGLLEPLVEPELKKYWAPEIAVHAGKYYLYYAGNLKMRVAVADRPTGPYQDTGKLLFPDLPFSIDGHPFQDPVSGKWYLFFARDFFDQRPGTALAVVQLGDDMISTVGPMHTVLRAFSDWQIYKRNRSVYNQTFPAWHTLEGPFVVYRDQKYYCFYSGGNWQTPGYGVGCAVSDALTGPYVDSWSKEGASVLRTLPENLIGPGHNSVIAGPDKNLLFIIYHSWNQERTVRQMCLDPLIWTGKGPVAWRPSRGQKTIELPFSPKE